MGGGGAGGLAATVVLYAMTTLAALQLLLSLANNLGGAWGPVGREGCSCAIHQAGWGSQLAVRGAQALCKSCGASMWGAPLLEAARHAPTCGGSGGLTPY